jgi:signal peptidase I
MRHNKKDDLQTLLKETGFNLLAGGKILEVRANGYSMYPAIKPGAIISIEPFSKGSEPHPGEIIAWKRESGLVVHRVVRVEKNNKGKVFITRGDSCKSEDPPVDAGKVAGKVISFKLTGNRTIKVNSDMNYKPPYRYNRFRVSLILRSKRIMDLLQGVTK